ncbi:Glycine cleavage T-protein (aminomethyl transferase) [Synechococcus sp. PCC 7335]|nr:Glycine cleavage T-protein (aminomethyl transferase) [Synechococcus sp. PCC 7335]
MGTLVTEYRIEASTAIAYPVQAGQYIQIIDVEGSQCSDFLAFAGDRHQEELDSTVTRTLLGVAMPQAGLHSKYFSQTMQPLVEVIQDTCDRHDSFLLACTNKYYEDAGYFDHPSCSDNFNQVLAPYGIAPRLGWPAINFFFNTAVDDSGGITSAESWSRPGDYVLLKAHQDLLCASSACPDDIDPANGWHPTPIHVRIYAAEENFPRAIGRRSASELPLRLTQDSAFTPRVRSLTQNLAEYNSFWVPMSYPHHGDQAEYWALRERVALMDLSALRKFEVIGPDALALLQWTFSRNVAKLAVGQSAYGCLLNPHGGMIDDGIVFRLGEVAYRYIGNCDTDGLWLQKVAKEKGFTVTISNSSDRLHNLALQGPYSRDLLEPLVEIDDGWEIENLNELKFFRFVTGTVGEVPVLLSRTGYTGELGYELFVHPNQGAQLWDVLMKAGGAYDLLPLGMQGLDRARIEAGLLAAGREFNDLISPYQVGIGWSVGLKTKPDFIGRAALEKIRDRPPFVGVGLLLEGNEVAGGGQCVYPVGDYWRVGHVTSGTFSPVLNRSIALAQVAPEYAQAGTELEVGMMDGIKRRIRVEVGPLSLYDSSKSRVRA